MNNLVTIARREALLSLGLAVLYMLSWWLSAYTVPANLLWHGWPLWFVLSCVFNPLLFVSLCAVMVRRYFKNVALDTAEPTANPTLAEQQTQELQTTGPKATADCAAEFETAAAFPVPTHFRPY